MTPTDMTSQTPPHLPAEKTTDRPQVTNEMVLVAAKEIAGKLDSANEGDAESIAEYYRHPMDGYKLARDLDRYGGWDISMSDVEELDNLSSVVDELLHQAEKQWAQENNIQPPLPIGARIEQGVIVSVSEHSIATYRVKMNGCTQTRRFGLIRFEDAVAVEHGLADVIASA